ncbi:hypothetical protein HETIRDRAFT_448074 [Heterobasidion irregulare TC 32-1]|uniref:Uncharacterized protein n=1 Tax=Heterobasidion irregulare (strain TC 32-1) TaxID=747525 RepID=W4KQB3_HETIT|nr:uncharacterized protein HETIRDRAFT_448074 [Heterobasidion irregulare TC 32-1]ETW87590.1 hypothetical protein HETIRDRAFT_448074 [Heterobasidion irregulare TC 32-1]
MLSSFSYRVPFSMLQNTDLEDRAGRSPWSSSLSLHPHSTKPAITDSVQLEGRTFLLRLSTDTQRLVIREHGAAHAPAEIFHPTDPWCLAGFALADPGTAMRALVRADRALRRRVVHARAQALCRLPGLVPPMAVPRPGPRPPVPATPTYRPAPVKITPRFVLASIALQRAEAARASPVLAEEAREELGIPVEDVGMSGWSASCSLGDARGEEAQTPVVDAGLDAMEVDVAQVVKEDGGCDMEVDPTAAEDARDAMEVEGMLTVEEDAEDADDAFEVDLTFWSCSLSLEDARREWLLEDGAPGPVAEEEEEPEPEVDLTFWSASHSLEDARQEPLPQEGASIPTDSEAWSARRNVRFPLVIEESALLSEDQHDEFEVQNMLVRSIEEDEWSDEGDSTPRALQRGEMPDCADASLSEDEIEELEVELLVTAGEEQDEEEQRMEDLEETVENAEKPVEDAEAANKVAKVCFQPQEDECNFDLEGPSFYDWETYTPVPDEEWMMPQLSAFQTLEAERGPFYSYF